MMVRLMYLKEGVFQTIICILLFYTLVSKDFRYLPKHHLPEENWKHHQYNHINMFAIFHDNTWLQFFESFLFDESIVWCAMQALVTARCLKLVTWFAFMDGSNYISSYFSGVTLLKMGSWTEVVLGVIRLVFIWMNTIEITCL